MLAPYGVMSVANIDSRHIRRQAITWSNIPSCKLEKLKIR